MPNYIIATSSTSDLPRTYLDAHQIPFIPYSYSVGEQLFEDDCREETRLSVYQGMRSADRICAFDRRGKITPHGVQFVEDRELLRHAAALSLRRDHPHIAEIGRCFRKADDTRRLYAVIVGNEYVPSIVHRLRYSFAVPFDRCFFSGFIIISSECTGYKPQKRQKPTVHWMLAPRLGHLWPKPVSASLLRISLSAFPAAAWFARNYPADNDRAGSPSVKLLARIFL